MFDKLIKLKSQHDVSNTTHSDKDSNQWFTI